LQMPEERLVPGEGRSAPVSQQEGQISLPSKWTPTISVRPSSPHTVGGRSASQD
jgi:hypothetical protein